MPQTHPKGFFNDVGNWIKRHPLAAAIIGVVVGLLVYLIVTNSQAQTANDQKVAPGGNYNPEIIVIQPSGPNQPPPTPPGTTPKPTLPPTRPPLVPPKGTKPPDRLSGGKLKGKPIIKRNGSGQHPTPKPKRRPPINIVVAGYGGNHPSSHGYEPSGTQGAHPR